jgi:biotin-(acetyl-CoA carboxylase) ligase
MLVQRRRYRVGRRVEFKTAGDDEIRPGKIVKIMRGGEIRVEGEDGRVYQVKTRQITLR